MCSKVIMLTTLVAVFMLSCITATDMTEQKYQQQREELVNEDIRAAYGPFGDGDSKEHKFYRILQNVVDDVKTPDSIEDIISFEKFDAFKLFKSMPKSALLRVNFTGAVGPEFILAQLTKGNLYQRSKKITREQYSNLDNMELQEFRFAESIDKLPAIKVADTEWILVQDVIDIVSLDKYEKYIRSITTMYHPDNEENKTCASHEEAKKKFNAVHVKGGILRHEPQWRELMQKIIENLIEDNILYAEIHSTCDNVYNAADKRFSVKEACQMLFDEVQKAKKDHPDKFFDVKIIYSPFKGTFKKSQHIDGFTDYTKTVVGFDASGFEDDFPLSAYAVPISNHFTGLNRTFQAGEITHAADSKESLFDAILLDAKRIGHGYTLNDHAGLLKIVKEKKICMEVCLISSLMLQFSKLAEHPAIHFEQLHKLTVSISSDNPGVHGTTMLTHDVLVAAKLIIDSRKHVHINQIYTWQVNGIEHSFLTAEEKTRARLMFDGKWNAFVDKIAADPDYQKYVATPLYEQPAIVTASSVMAQ